MFSLFIDYIDPDSTWSQKLTLTIQTPDGEYSASSIASAGQFSAGIMGRATYFSEGLSLVLKLPNEKYLFVLRGHPLDMIYDTFYNSVKLNEGEDNLSKYEFYQYVPSIDTKLPLARKSSPLFVTFDDINNPTSIKLVDPDNLSLVLGQNYKFKNLTLEVTNETINYKTIQQISPWLKGRLRKPLYEGRCTNCTDAVKKLLQQLHTTDFRLMGG